MNQEKVEHKIPTLMKNEIEIKSFLWHEKLTQKCSDFLRELTEAVVNHELIYETAVVSVRKEGDKFFKLIVRPYSSNTVLSRLGVID